MSAVYRDLDLEMVLSEYQPALHIPSLDDVMAQYAERGAVSRPTTADC